MTEFFLIKKEEKCSLCIILRLLYKNYKFIKIFNIFKQSFLRFITPSKYKTSKSGLTNELDILAF